MSRTCCLKDAAPAAPANSAPSTNFIKLFCLRPCRSSQGLRWLRAAKLFSTGPLCSRWWLMICGNGREKKKDLHHVLQWCNADILASANYTRSSAHFKAWVGFLTGFSRSQRLLINNDNLLHFLYFTKWQLMLEKKCKLKYCLSCWKCARRRGDAAEGFVSGKMFSNNKRNSAPKNMALMSQRALWLHP